MKDSTFKRLAKLVSITLIFNLLFLTEVQAQLTTALNLRPIFSSTSGNPDLLFKYDLSDGKFAIRTKVSGNITNSKSNQNFYEDDRYYNLDQWPEDISMEGSTFKFTTLNVSPGVEFRRSLSETSTFYYGLDITYTRSQYDNQGNWHSSFKDNNIDKYIIQQVRSNSSSNTTTSIAPTPLIGFQQQIANGFSVLLEGSVNVSWQRSIGDNENLIYLWDWNTEEFYTPDPQEEFKEQEQPWNFNGNLNPRIDLYIAYTFGTGK